MAKTRVKSLLYPSRVCEPQSMRTKSELPIVRCPGRACGSAARGPTATIGSKAAFSPDSRILYFLSNRDGHFCIWAHRLHPDNKTPEGDAFGVQHFHDSGPSIEALDGGIGAFGLRLATAKDRLVLSLGERTGNIWMLEPVSSR